MTIGDGKVVMANPDDKGQADIVADTDGEVKIRVDGQYLAQALKACGGMVDLKLSSSSAPMLFSLDGYQLVVMPMLTDKTQAEAKATTTQPEPEATEPKKAKRSRVKQPVTAE